MTKFAVTPSSAIAKSETVSPVLGVLSLSFMVPVAFALIMAISGLETLEIAMSKVSEGSNNPSSTILTVTTCVVPDTVFAGNVRVVPVVITA